MSYTCHHVTFSVCIFDINFEVDMNLSTQELVNMVFILGECQKCPLLASRVYASRYPDQERKPRTNAFQSLLERFEQTGNVAFTKHNVLNKHTTNEENELTVLLVVQENPQISTAEIERVTDIERTSIKRILKKHKYHPYHMELHQQLYDRDYASRELFSITFLNKIWDDPNFTDNVLFSDEATFKSNGNINRHNMHYFSVENPHWVRQVDNQNKWSINVWGGIIGSHIIGPFFFEEQLTGQVYLNFLRNELPILLENLNLATRTQFWFQHDGAPPHYHRDVRNYLNNWKTNRWIGRGGKIAWPPRSPDLSPIDFFLWGHIKQEVYKEIPTTAEDMKARIRRSFDNISERTLQKVKLSFTDRLEMCLQLSGGLFEHFV